MTAATDPAETPRAKPSRWLLVPGLLLALLGGAGGFYGVKLLGPGGILPPGHGAAPRQHAAGTQAAYVPIDPIIITLPRASGREFLRFAATLEVTPSNEAEVSAITPRIIDVMNDYLRAVEPADFESRMILADLRSQLLRRIQVVTGEGRVRDLLIIEFVLN